MPSSDSSNVAPRMMFASGSTSSRDAFERLVERRAEDDVCVRIDFLADAGRSFVDFEEGQVATAGDRDQQALCALHRRFVEQWVGDCSFGSLHRAALAGCFAGAHHRAAHFAHDRTDVGEVEVDETFLHHQVGDAGNAGVEYLVSHRESVGKGRLVVGNAEEVLVRNDDQRVDRLLQLFDSGFGQTHAATALEVERLGNDADREDALVSSRLSDNRSSAGAGAAAHAGGDEAHVRTVQVIDDFIDALFGCGTADFRLRTSTETFSDVGAELDDALRLGHRQGLGIRVGNDEVDALEASGDHVVDSVAAAAANTEHGDTRLKLSDIRLLQLDSHVTVPSLYGRIATPANSLNCQKLSFNHCPMRAKRLVFPPSDMSRPLCDACVSWSATCG